MVLDVMETCQSTAFSLVLPIIKRGLFIIQIVAPILLMLMASIQFIDMASKPDDKKNYKKLINKVVAAFMIFIIPVFINVIMGLVGESTEFSKCWNEADDSKKVEKSEYKGDDNLTPAITKKDYEGSNEKKDDSKDSNNKTNDKTNDKKTTISRIVFVGDSRTVGLYATKSGNWSGDYSKSGANEYDKDVYIGESSQGLSWLKSTGMPAATNYMSSGTAIVILMGVNDTSNIDGYISYLKDNVSTWTGKGAKIYYSAVTPCDGSSKSLNTKIENFNSKLKSNLPSGITWIDTYSYLNSNGFTTTDGVHYNSDTYNKIYSYIKSTV